MKPLESHERHDVINIAEDFWVLAQQMKRHIFMYNTETGRLVLYYGSEDSARHYAEKYIHLIYFHGLIMMYDRVFTFEPDLYHPSLG